ncbi:MAG: hypothetical protein ACTHOP_14075 [Mesorhizobium sp.]
MLEQLSNRDLSEIEAELSAVEQAIDEFGAAMEKLRRRLAAELERHSNLKPT